MKIQKYLLIFLILKKFQGENLCKMKLLSSHGLIGMEEPNDNIMEMCP